ncbi:MULTISPECIES: hypothetical protein [unclassified Dysgonomonas]|jgi:hypothetical protein|uniref:hypothetical protein n=1 Tax=unclassified Dysgonomonas TaxID=2630389 RepID=UPI0025C46BFD|nr:MULTISPECIES: hypothetical protein [unclassified Dysgonomonas]MDR2003972.1 hypothetical protein [Prevotella sp.]HMM04002.1 hypothetical protein [Dysgonomonas sp.]
MIDRITFQIKDYDLEELKKRLPLDKPMSVSPETGEINKGTHLRNLSLTLASSGDLWLKNSLHKFKQGGYNYNPFTPKEAQKAIIEIYKTLKIPLANFIVTNIEIGVNMRMPEDPMNYINTIRYYEDTYRFIPMKPLYKTSKIKGISCSLSEYEIKFYDKTFHSKHRKSKVERDKVRDNILRYEIGLSSKQSSMLGFKNFKPYRATKYPLTAEHLLNPRFYSRFIRVLRNTFYKISFHDIETDYTKFSPEEAKRYIFAMSEDYQYYLDYLKKYQGEKEFRKEMRANDIFLKKIEPLKNSKYEKELKEIFEKTMSEMMGAKLSSSEIEKLLLF